MKRVWDRVCRRNRTRRTCTGRTAGERAANGRSARWSNYFVRAVVGSRVRGSVIYTAESGTLDRSFDRRETRGGSPLKCILGTKGVRTVSRLRDRTSYFVLATVKIDRKDLLSVGVQGPRKRQIHYFFSIGRIFFLWTFRVRKNVKSITLSRPAIVFEPRNFTSMYVKHSSF